MKNNTSSTEEITKRNIKHKYPYFVTNEHHMGIGLIVGENRSKTGDGKWDVLLGMCVRKDSPEEPLREPGMVCTFLPHMYVEKFDGKLTIGEILMVRGSKINGDRMLGMDLLPYVDNNNIQLFKSIVENGKVEIDNPENMGKLDLEKLIEDTYEKIDYKRAIIRGRKVLIQTGVFAYDHFTSVLWDSIVYGDNLGVGRKTYSIILSDINVCIEHNADFDRNEEYNKAIITIIS